MRRVSADYVLDRLVAPGDLDPLIQSSFPELVKLASLPYGKAAVVSITEAVRLSATCRALVVHCSSVRAHPSAWFIGSKTDCS